MDTGKELKQILNLFNRYLEDRLNDEPIQILNEHIREMRISLQHAVTHVFLPLPIDKAREFRRAMADRLTTLCDEKRGRSSSGELQHQGYAVRQIMSCFEWAEQIKEEVPDDPITQQVLAVDIPILRPFDYGLGKKPQRG